MKVIVIALCTVLATVTGDVSHIVNKYLPPQHVALAPQPLYSASVAHSSPLLSTSTNQLELSDSVPVHSQGAVSSISTAVQTYDVAPSAPVQNYNFAASAPLQNYGGEVSSSLQNVHLGQSYHTAAAVPAEAVSIAATAPVQSSSVVSSLPVQNYNLPAASVSLTPAILSGVQGSYHESAAGTLPAVTSHEIAASEAEPAHTYSSNSGYHYKTQRRVIRRHRRESGYLPPQHSAVSNSLESGSGEYLPPHNFVTSHYETAPIESSSHYDSGHETAGPIGSYESALVQQYVSSPHYETGPGSISQYYDSSAGHVEPAHSYSASEGYRYKTNRRRVYRRHRY